MWFGPGRERGRTGTKFRLFPQPSFSESIDGTEVVWVSSPAGTVGPGPSDERMYVVDPIGKEQAYGAKKGAFGSTTLYLPPWDGEVFSPAAPDELGHFDYLEPGTPEFEAAHLYGTVRRTLDVWEGYFGREIPWHFSAIFDRLEITRLQHLDNAYAGFGFLEAGSHFTETGAARPFSLNFDVIAHEVGHLIIYAEVGNPTDESAAGEYHGFHESAADLVAMITVLHFESVVDELFEMTSGNLYTFNELNRFAELSDNAQIRLASNDRKLSEFADGWRKEHDLSQPLTGALFDILVDVFHESLLDRGLIDPRVEDLSDQIEDSPEYDAVMQPLFDRAYHANPEGFRQALFDARDYLGVALARTWSRLSPHYLTYHGVGQAMLDFDDEVTGGLHRRIIENNFLRRGIGLVRVGPRISPPDATSHAFSDRTVVPGDQEEIRPRSYAERMARAGRCGIPHR